MVRLADAEDVLAYASDEEWARYLPVPHPYRLRDAEEFVVTTGPSDFTSVQDGLKEAGIEAKAFWTPLHLQPPYTTCVRDPDLTRTEALWDKLICLPCGTSLTEADQNKVIKCAKSL